MANNSTKFVCYEIAWKAIFHNLKEQIYYQNYNLKKLELTDQNMIILWADVQLYYLQGLVLGDQIGYFWLLGS